LNVSGFDRFALLGNFGNGLATEHAAKMPKEDEKDRTRRAK